MKKLFTFILLNYAIFTSQVIAQNRQLLSHSSHNAHANDWFEPCDVEMGCTNCRLIGTESLACTSSTAAAAAIGAGSYWGLPLKIIIPTLGATSVGCLIAGLCLWQEIGRRMPNTLEGIPRLDNDETEEEFV